MTYDGWEEEEIRRFLDAPRVALRASVGSTMDLARELADDGAPSGTVVLADEQTHGRGRGGRSWTSEAERGLWLTLLERPADAGALDVLSLRVGLAAAGVLDRHADAPVQLKWPNDLMLPAGKLAGILIETRWREQRPEWVAIGIGINVQAAAGVARSAALGVGCRRMHVLGELLPAVRAVARLRGALSRPELQEYDRRDWARGRRAEAPAIGRVAGVSPQGALLIDTAGGTVACGSGSLVLAGREP
ncbi:MAG: biotin--[acetyl-CoA-carboxylase] ligase [Gemmatimonadaceae bacterium]